MNIKTLKEFFALRSLIKNDLVQPEILPPIPFDKLSREELVDAIKILDASETHYIKITGKLVHELSHKELLYPIYGFIAGGVAMAASILLFNYVQKQGGKGISELPSVILNGAKNDAAPFQGCDRNQIWVEVDLSLENFYDNPFLIKGSDCKLPGNIFSSHSPSQNFDTKLTPRSDKCGDTRDNNSEYIL